MSEGKVDVISGGWGTMSEKPAPLFLWPHVSESANHGGAQTAWLQLKAHGLLLITYIRSSQKVSYNIFL